MKRNLCFSLHALDTAHSHQRANSFLVVTGANVN